jgi:very-short-patch-repair endonuclease
VTAPAAARRLDRWKLSLLDLTLRNRLLDARDGRQVVPLAGVDAVALAARLDDGAPLELGTTAVIDPAAVGGAERAAEAMAKAGADALAHGRLLAALAPDELDRRLVAMARSARESLQESGASTLWLGLGALRWFETDGGEVARHAPLALLPVELRRAGPRERYQLAVRADEDARWNDTLFEKLASEFGIRVTPPGGERDDLDLAGLIGTLAAAVAKLPGWQVLPEARLGVFAFAKFVMWTDLAERGEALLAAPVVHHLATGDGAAFPAQPAFPDAATLDATLPLGELFAPLDCDASQLAAVLAAAAGRSFVLQGPPGTGKSQTITNLIAQALTHGKTVLFVAEKQAALEVVQRRLAAAGLGDFCLELHSHKAGKREVIGELGRVLERVWRPNAPVTGDDQRLAAARAELNRYVAALHAPGVAGISAHDALGQLGRLRDAPALPDGTAATAEAIAAQRDAVRRFAEAAAALAPVAAHPWHGSTLATWQLSTEDAVRAALAEAATAAAALGTAVDALAPRLPGVGARSRDQLEALGTLADHLAKTPHPGVELIAHAKAHAGSGASGPNGAVAERIAQVKARAAGGDAEVQAPTDVVAWLALARRRRELARGLAARWSDRVYALPLTGLAARFQAWAHRFPLFRWFALRAARKQARAALTAGALPADTEVATDLTTAATVVDAERALAAARPDAGRWLGALAPVADDGGDLTRVDAALTWARELAAAFDRTAVAPADRASAWQAIVAVAADPAQPAASWAELAAAVARWRTALGRLRDVCGVEVIDDERPHLAGLTAQVAAWAAAPTALRDWTAYVRARAAAVAAGLTQTVAGVESGAVPADAIVAAWERALYRGVADRAIAADPALAEFHGASHHARVAEFVELDRAQLGVAQARAIARLAERVPRVSADTADAGEIGTLLHELKKQRRHKPLRALFQAIPNLLPRLKPCLLMSPLSVAQYLDPAIGRFDLVVFDEASQIPTADAIGALARGEAAVVVGDSKQLPPTRFFAIGDGAAAAAGAAPDDDEVEELESILDECVAARLPELRLTWHYRSHHEDLIAFSNQHYYDGGLDVFPAAAADVAGLGVGWRKVAGVYDRAGTRQNRAEAEAVVAEVIARLTDPARAARSIGVVTFSRPQQELVLDLLDAARAADPALDRFFADDAKEPVLVKNLETIQGDERDVILFSIGYGPDAAGKVTMNFGPLNKAGGERRLNVAVTRARDELVVFSSLEPEQLDPDVAALGVRHLGELLRYARAGGQPPGERQARPPATPTAAAIAAALTAKGLTLHHQVGCAGYKIDLAVVDPDDPGRYVLGIETDGPAYARAATARDRDRLRAQVLTSLGWQLHRIWSLDWLHDPDKELGRAYNAAINAIARARSARKAPGSRSATPIGVPTAAGSGPRATSASGPVAAPAALAATAPVAVAPAATAPAPIAPVATAPALTAPAVARTPIGRYVVAPVVSGRRTADDLHDLGRGDELGKVIDTVLAVEAPIHAALLARRVATAYGIGRMTPKVVDRVRMIAATRAQVGSPVEPDVVWRRDQDPAALPSVRVPDDSRPDSKRDGEHLPLIELAAAARLVLERNLGLPRVDLVKETAKLVGFVRPGDKLAARIDLAIGLLISRGGAAATGDRVALGDA